MQRIPKERFDRHYARLRALNVPERAKPHHVKWVRYFLDFESKYR